MTKCTWQDPPDKQCLLDAEYSHRGSDGVQWANLCQSHNNVLKKAMMDCDPKAILRSWVRAGGGAKKMAARM